MRNRLARGVWNAPLTDRRVVRLARTDLKFVETMLLLGFGETSAELDSLARIQQRAAAVATAKELTPKLTPGWTYRGEYLSKPKHNSLVYSRIPEKHVILFDINTGHEQYLPYDDVVVVAIHLGLEVVPWRKVSTDLEALDAERDLPSEVAVRRGITLPREREGVVLRPLVEMTLNNSERVIVKHKGDKFRETAKPRPVVDADKLAVLTQAQEIADEWVTGERLRHVLSKIELDGKVADMVVTSVVIAAMVEDIYREGRGEIVESKEARTAIGTSTAKLFKVELSSRLRRG